MTLLDVTVLGLAVFRMSMLLVEERGPFYLFAWLRLRAGIRHDTNNLPYVVYARGWRMEVGELFLCVWCMSVWVGMAVTLAYLWVPTLTVWMCLPFALSALALVLQKQVG